MLDMLQRTNKEFCGLVHISYFLIHIYIFCIKLHLKLKDIRNQ